MSVDILPSSRTKVTRRSTWSEFWGCNMVPVYCASCHKQWGWVPEYGQVFSFVHCDECAPKYGDAAHFHKEPDAVYWEQMAFERAKAASKRLPQGLELDAKAAQAFIAAELSNPTSALSKLQRELEARIHRTL